MLIEVFCVILVLALLFCSAYFAACETAITGYSKPKISTMAKSGNAKAKLILNLQKDIDLVLSSILTLNTITNSLTVSVSNVVCIDIFGNSAIFYCPFIISVLIVLFAEVLPKMITISDPESILLPSTYFIKYVYAITKPLNRIIGCIAKKMISIIKSEDSNKLSTSSLDELRGAIDLHAGTNENIKQEKEMLQSILDLGDIQVGDIMVHRKNVTMLCADDKAENIIKQVMNCPFTRIPLWSGNQNNIIGILHAKDLLKATQDISHNNDVTKIAIKPWFIPKNNGLLNQLQSFKLRHEHFAIVVDEYGNFVGIITLEDILEEIVGDIS
ncbi:MAG: CNNM domain-containing protein, partial [Holosporales bacterium]|nr:CNNM domain-containing protein [Holosporales bacterium]